MDGIMRSKLNRRSFIQRAALAAGASQLLSFPCIGASGKPAGKLRVVQVGCGGRAMQHLEQVVVRYNQNLVAIVDPDDKGFGRAVRHVKEKGGGIVNPRTFTDYRVMFDKIGKQIDAVFIATPNHHHAAAAMMAMQLGKGVYCEKPLCHDIAEARAAARQWPPDIQGPHPNGQPGPLRGRLPPAVRIHLGRRHRQHHRDP